MTSHAGSDVDAAIQAPEKHGSATSEDARKFIETAETKLLDIWIRASRAQWVQQTFITHDTEILSAEADQVVKATTADLAVAVESIRTPEAARRCRPKNLSSQALRGYSRATRSRRAS